MDMEAITIETFRLGLIAPVWYLKTLRLKPELIDKLSNGVGSETHWSYHFTPNTIWGLNILPTACPHDSMYCCPIKFKSVAQGLAWKRLADYYFHINGTKQIDDYGGWLEFMRFNRLSVYETALDAGGSEAFWINKERPKDFLKYYEKEPEDDKETMFLYKKVWGEIGSL